jgi:hypothetical protein
MIDTKTALANLDFIRATLTEIARNDPVSPELARYHAAESLECAKTVEAFIKQGDAP